MGVRGLRLEVPARAKPRKDLTGGDENEGEVELFYSSRRC